MENAVDAMKMAFAMLVFIVALSLAMYSFTMVRQTSDRIAQESDTKEYYDRISLEETGETTGISSSALASSSRIVGVETVIPTLYRYYKENYTVLFYKGTGYDESTGRFSNITPMVLYYTETDDNYLKNSSLIYGTRGVFGFDIQDEQIRREPWSATEETDFSFIRAFINGTETDKFYTSKRTSVSGRNSFRNDNDGMGPYYTINFANSNDFKGLIGKDLKFIERYGEYNYNNVASNSGTPDYEIDSSVTGSVDVLENDEIITKRNQTTNKLIKKEAVMSDTVVTVIAIFLAAILMFIFPLMSTADRTDDISTQAVDTATTEFVDEIRSTGKITQDNYDNFVQTISSTGNSFDVELEVQVLDDNPGKKVTEAEMTKVGENYYYSQYTSQILDTVNSNGAMYLKEGDIVSVTVKNTNRTISAILKDFIYRVTGNNSASITAQHSGIVNVNGK